MEMQDLRGLDFIRTTIAKAALPDGSQIERAGYAATRWGCESKPAWFLRSLTNAGSTTDPNNAAALAAFGQAGAEFFSLVRERSLLGQMPELVNVPPQKRIVRQTNGTNASWVGEGQTIPVTSGGFTKLTLAALQLFAMTVQTIELIMMSDLDSELIFRNDMVATISETMDASFTDPANAGVANLMPASVTYGAPTVTSTGNHAADLASLIELFNGDLNRSYFVGNPATLTKFSGADRPNVGARGGEMLGVPTLSSRKVPADILVLIDAGGVGFANGIPDISVSRNGTVEMETAPTSPTTASTVLVSLWQENLIGIKISQIANWSARSGSVVVLDGLAASGI